LLQKSGHISRISEMRLMSGGTWDWGLGTGGGMRINSDDCMKARLGGRPRRMDAHGGNEEVRGT
jgi:hypothetical protein